MTTNRTFVRRHHRGELTHWQEMELWLGPGPHGSAFESRAELRDAWARNRDRLMTIFAKHGRRPAGWWEFEAPFPRPFEHEASALYTAGLLTESESTELLNMWRREFKRANEPDFFFTTAPGRILKGAAARQAHLQWADVPPQLIEKWSADRRHRPAADLQVEGAAS
jgi:hypothetical protein